MPLTYKQKRGARGQLGCVYFSSSGVHTTTHAHTRTQPAAAVQRLVTHAYLTHTHEHQLLLSHARTPHERFCGSSTPGGVPLLSPSERVRRRVTLTRATSGTSSTSRKFEAWVSWVGHVVESRDKFPRMSFGGTVKL